MVDYKDSPATLRALAYPLALDGNGGLKLSYGVDVVRDEIRSVLETYHWERIMRPKYGLPLSLIFSSYQVESIAAERIRIAIVRDVVYSGLTVDVTAQIDEQGAIGVQVDWSMNGTPQIPLKYRLLP